MRIERLKSNHFSENVSDDKVNLSLLDPLIEKYKNKRGNLIPLLQGAQHIYGYIPKSVFLRFEKEVGLHLNDMYGVATFYAQFRLQPVGKHIVKVCHGTACHVQNASKISEAIEDTLKIKDGETTNDRLFTIESVACLGCCSLAPVMMIGDETYGSLDGKKATKIIKEIRRQEQSNQN